MKNPVFSVVIPALNEADFLPRLLQSIERAVKNSTDRRLEVIVADHGSRDDTAKIARKLGCRVVNVKAQTIAAVRNAGAREARGQRLVFVDADSEIHPETFNTLEWVALNPQVIAASTGFEYDRKSIGIQVTHSLLKIAGWMGGIETGLICCSRSAFKEIGGFRPEMRKSEDVRLILDLKRLGRIRNQCYQRLRGIPVRSSTRKFDVRGDWHIFGLLLKAITYAILPGKTVDQVIDDYWYSDAARDRTAPREK